MAKAANDAPHQRGQRRRDIGVILWISFLAACAGTFVIFAVLDPEALNDAWVLPWRMGRKLAYSLGFAFLFCVGGLASALTVVMIRSGPGQGSGNHPTTDANHSAAAADAAEQELLDPGDWR